MARITVDKIEVKEPEGKFSDPITFDVTFQAHQELADDLEWKVTYVIDDDASKDQVLDAVVVGPTSEGRHQFELHVPAPDPSKISNQDLRGATVLLMTALYMDQEFIRIGWYCNIDYESDEMKQEPPEVPVVDSLHRSILSSKPRVTRFHINWDNKYVDAVTEEFRKANERMQQQEELNNPSTTNNNADCVMSNAGAPAAAVMPAAAASGSSSAPVNPESQQTSMDIDG